MIPQSLQRIYIFLVSHDLTPSGVFNFGCLNMGRSAKIHKRIVSDIHSEITSLKELCIVHIERYVV